MAVIITYRCPQCNENVQPVLRLICSPVIQCGKCKTPMRVHPGMVVSNWTRGLYFWGVLLCWLVVGFWGFWTQGVNKPPAEAFGFVIGLVLIGWFPGLILALPLLLVGHVIGIFMSWKLDRPERATYMEYTNPNAYRPQEHDWK
jgi:hypothetical protein